jgi:hypothetical protein
MSAPSKGLTKELTVTDVDTPKALVVATSIVGGVIAVSDSSVAASPSGDAFLIETGDYLKAEDGNFILTE